ncbi:unnamed protein product, partial [Prunus brigantina]
MEQIFHEQFYWPELEVSMADLAKMRQGSNESVQEYLRKFREARARCTVNMPEHEFVKLAQVSRYLRPPTSMDRYETLLKEEQQKNRPTSRPTFYRGLPKPSTSRTMVVHAMDIEDVDSEERNEEVFQEEEEESAGINLAKIDLIDRKVLKFPEKATMGVDQNMFPNAQANMVVPPKAKEPSREPTRESAKEQAQTIRPNCAGKNMMKSSAENYCPHSPRDMTDIRPNKRPLHEYQDGSMWVSVGEGKNREVAYVSRPRPADGSGIPTFKMPNTKAGQWYRSREFEWEDERQAQLNRLVELREKLWLEELELAKADVVASLEAAAAEERKIRWQWANGQAKSSGPTKGLDDGPSKVEKPRKVQLKAKPPALKNQVATKVVSTSEVDEKKENDHEMVKNVRGKTQTREDKPKVEEDQVMVDVQTPEAEEKAEATTDVEATEASENPEGTLADNEELYGVDEGYGDDEYFEELTEEVMEQLAKECT